MVLRKLTKKSQLKFGKYADYRILDLLTLNKHSYLRWVYYMSSNINFFDDILDELGIGVEYRIQKPGKDEALYKKIIDQRLFVFKEFSCQETAMNRKLSVADKKRRNMFKVNKTFNKNDMRLINQGKNVIK